MCPKIFLAIDNCFATKRWSEVSDWMDVIRDLGISCVEASADNEIDPLFSTPVHLDDWIAAVETEGERTGVQVVNSKGKTKQFGRLSGRRKDGRKAYVRLAEGSDIDFGAGA